MVGTFQHFQGICCLHFQVRKISQVETRLQIWAWRKGNLVISNPPEDCYQQRTSHIVRGGVNEGIMSKVSEYNIHNMNLFHCTKKWHGK
jgi:hypothetical protein